MRLLKINDNGDLSLTVFTPREIPCYAILSHTWEVSNQELTFQDMVNGSGRGKAGYKKIQFCRDQAQKDGLQYIWVDSCCIDRSSSAELAEAINSMFRWYRNAVKCYVYLSDVPTTDGDQQTFRRSRWFTRGWTLQELLAPRKVDFFSREGQKIGDKQSLELLIHEITGIPVQALQEFGGSLAQFSVNERFSWTAKRETTIEEDQAYCLLGIFDIHLPPIYGEGKEHAFRRLRMEISAGNARDAPRMADSSIAEKNNACLASLAAKDQSAFVSQTLCRSRYACTWILKKPKYISWFESRGSSLLWMTAQAGCGKTTMAAHVCQMISSNRIPKISVPQQETTCAVLFFFFQPSDQEDQKTALVALSTLVSQLVRQVPQALPILLRRYELLSAKGDFEWSWDNLSGVFSKMLEQTPVNSRVYIILDALDECKTKSQMLILDWIKGLVNENASHPVLKVFVTSRTHGDIFDQLSGFPTLAIKEADTVNDIQTLIHSRVEELAQRRCLNSDITQAIVQFLKKNAHGMFIWVVLVMKELERRDERLSDEVIESKLSRIPFSLINTYETILRHTSPTRKQDMWRIIRWLLFGSRDLTLAELEQGLCLETGGWYDFVGDLKVLCGSLIRLDGPRGEVSFVHQTARDFLRQFIENSSAADTGKLNMNAHAANEHLAAICVQYMLSEQIFQEVKSFKSHSTTHSSYMDTIRDFLGRYPLLRYAIESWALHLRAVSTPSSVTTTLVVKLLSSGTTRDGIMTLTYFLYKRGSWYVPVNQNPLHLAAYFNIPWLVQVYISSNKSFVQATTPMNDTPLIWASEMGSTECVQMLLDAGADPNEYEFDHWSALHWAARNGHLGVATLLLEHNARLDHRDINGYTPLDWAFDREHWHVVDLFEEWIAKHDPGRLGKYGRHDLILMEASTSDYAPCKEGKLWDYRP